MSENIRRIIQEQICKAFVAINNEDKLEAQAALCRILDTLEKPESLEYTVNKFERGSFQFFMQI